MTDASTTGDPELSAGQPPDTAADAEPATETESLRQKLEEVQKTADQYKDQLLRKAAEFENFKRRSEADFAGIIRNANESLVSSLLPVLDDLARSLRSGTEGRDFDSFFRGVELIQAKLLKTLEAQGLASFDSVGKPFDVAYHDALLAVPRNDVPPHTVLEEVERGYRFNDRVLRHARVTVSAAPAGDGGEAPDSGTDT